MIIGRAESGAWYASPAFVGGGLPPRISDATDCALTQPTCNVPRSGCCFRHFCCCHPVQPGVQTPCPASVLVLVLARPPDPSTFPLGSREARVEKHLCVICCSPVLFWVLQTFPFCYSVVISAHHLWQTCRPSSPPHPTAHDPRPAPCCLRLARPPATLRCRT